MILQLIIATVVVAPVQKSAWKSPQTDQEWKAKNLEEIKARLSGFQHEAFERSYI